MVVLCGNIFMITTYSMYNSHNLAVLDHWLNAVLKILRDRSIFFKTGDCLMAYSVIA